MTPQRVLTATILFSLLVAACADGVREANVDSSGVATAPIPAVQSFIRTGWNESTAGPVMILSVAGDIGQAAIVLPHMTDSSLAATAMFSLDRLMDLPVELFGPAGRVGRASLVVASQKLNTEGCVMWPEGTLAGVPSRPWRVGFRQGIATAFPLDSLEGMNTEDSLAVTGEIARLASALTEKGDPTFHGLPFSVRKAYRYTMPPVSALVADVVRKINEEANPREEHILLVGERVAGGDGKYMVAFYTRVAGSEDVVRTNEILGAVRFTRAGQPALVVAFEYGDGGRVALLERTGDRQWKITWRSAYTGC